MGWFHQNFQTNKRFLIQNYGMQILQIESKICNQLIKTGCGVIIVPRYGDNDEFSIFGFEKIKENSLSFSFIIRSYFTKTYQNNIDSFLFTTDFACNPGEYLDIQGDQECHPCAAGSYSLGGGIRFSDWSELPQGFAVKTEKMKQSAWGMHTKLAFSGNCSR